MSELSNVVSMLDAPAGRTLFLALVHFLWQGLGIAAVLWLVLKRTRDPAVQYAVSCSALVAMLAVPIVTWAIFWSQLPSSAIIGLDGFAETSPMDSGSAARGVETLHDVAPKLEAYVVYLADAARPMLVTAWMTGVAVLMVRLAAGWCYAHVALVRGGRCTTASWEELLETIVARMGIRRNVRLRVRMDDVGPCVIGWLRPVILMPMTMLTRLPAWQVEAILAHELAHVRRHDYLVNLLQSLAETLLFYHPAVWWVSGRIRESREHCCDREAATMCGGPIRLARALVQLHALRMHVPVLSAAAAGGELTDRVRRLLSDETRTSSSNRRLRASGGALLLTAVLLILLPACGDLVDVEGGAPTSEFVIDAPHAETARQILARNEGTEGPTLELFRLLENGDAHVLETTVAMYRLAADPALRRNVILPLLRIGTEAAARQLIYVARFDPSSLVRGDALRALGRMTTVQPELARPELRSVALDRDREMTLRAAAIEALGKVPSEHAFLKDLVRRSGDTERQIGLWALSQVRNDQAFMAEIMQAHPEEDFRFTGFSALQGDPILFELLLVMAESDPSEAMRSMAASYLDRHVGTQD